MKGAPAPFPPKDLLPGPEEIPEGNDGQHRRQGGEESVARLECRLDEEELGKKTEEGRNAGNAHGPHQKSARGPWHLPAESPHASHLPGPRRLNHHPRHEEEHRLREGVIDDEEERTHQGEWRSNPEAQDDVTHLAHAGIRQEALDIRLGESPTGPHYHGDGRQGQNPLLDVGPEGDEDHAGDPKDAVGPHLDQDTGEHGTDGGRGTRVGIGQPEVEGEHGGLHPEDRHKEEENGGEGAWVLKLPDLETQIGHVEGPHHPVQPAHRQQKHC